MTEVPETKILTYNRLAMEWLRKGNIKKAEDYLSKAQEMLNTRAKSRQIFHLQAITFNNLGCVYKRKGKFELALKYLEIALNHEENHSYDILNLAGIHLNMSAIFSQLNLHEISLKHALAAKKTLLQKTDKDSNIWVSLVISYQSAGYEYECLSNLESAIDMYLKGWELAQDHLGAFHSITEKLKKNYSVLSKNLKVQRSKLPLRSKTPSLLPKSSNLSLIEKPGQQKPRDSSNTRLESYKNFDTLDLLINEIEFGKSESSTEVPSYNKPDYLKKITKSNRKVLTFEKLPKLDSNHLKMQSRQAENFEISERVEDKDLKIETDEEYSDEFASESMESPEIPTVRSLNSSIKSENSLIIPQETGRSSENSEKSQEKLTTTNKEPESVPLNTSEIQERLVFDKSVQTESPEKVSSSCQVSISFAPFRRIAAIIIQKHWRAYKRRKDPGYFEYLKEVRKARLDAEEALHKVDQIKLSYKNKKKVVIDGPVPKRSKIRV